MAETVLIDAGPLAALLDRREQWHPWASEQMRQLKTPLLTCEAVLSETCFLIRHLQRAQFQLHQWAADGLLKLLPPPEGALSDALTLMRKYADVPMSFADASLVLHDGLHPQARIFTLDSDFSIYRRADGSALPLLAPFAD